MTTQVTLFSKNGSRTAEINPKGFGTRHVKTRSNSTPPGLIPSIFENTTESQPHFGEVNGAYQMSTPDFTESTLLDIIEKMTASDEADNSKAGGWLCEDAIFKVARVNLRHNVTAPAIRQMLSDLTTRGDLEYKTEYGLNKFRLAKHTHKPTLKALLDEVNAKLGTTGIADAVGVITITVVSWAAYVIGVA